MDQNRRLQQLFHLYYNGDATETQVGELMQMIEEASDETLADLLHQAWDQTPVGNDFFGEAVRQKMVDQLRTSEAGSENVSRPGLIRKMMVWKYAVAAALLLVLSTTVVLLMQKDVPVPVAHNPKIEPVQQDVAPGGDKAILTLADGSQIILDTAGKGALTQQGGIMVINNDGQLAYQAENEAKEVLYNTVSTPRGGQYQLVLADGTKVWLNAASSLRFPTAFAGEERIVELTGEGYFEVAHNAAQPFHVKAGAMDVQVMGTHFNINSYGDEPTVKTTLLEGRVKVTKNDKHVFLNPGQQAVVQPEQGKITVNNEVDVEQVIAWKEGFFRFNHTDLQTIMRQIARWYNVDVVYAGPASKHYNGKIYRESNISKVLQLLEKTGTVKFVIEGKKIIVNTN